MCLYWLHIYFIIIIVVLGSLKKNSKYTIMSMIELRFLFPPTTWRAASAAKIGTCKRGTPRRENSFLYGCVYLYTTHKPIVVHRCTLDHCPMKLLARRTDRHACIWHSALVSWRTFSTTVGRCNAVFATSALKVASSIVDWHACMLVKRTWPKEAVAIHRRIHLLDCGQQWLVNHHRRSPSPIWICLRP